MSRNTIEPSDRPRSEHPTGTPPIDPAVFEALVEGWAMLLVDDFRTRHPERVGANVAGHGIMTTDEGTKAA